MGPCPRPTRTRARTISIESQACSDQHLGARAPHPLKPFSSTVPIKSPSTTIVTEGHEAGKRELIHLPVWSNNHSHGHSSLMFVDISVISNEFTSLRTALLCRIVSQSAVRPHQKVLWEPPSHFESGPLPASWPSLTIPNENGFSRPKTRA